MRRKPIAFNLKTKLILSYLCILLIPIFVLGTYLTDNLSRTILNNTKEHYTNSAQVLRQNLFNRLSALSDIARNIMFDQKILNYLNMETQSEFEVYQYYMDFISPIFKQALFKENGLKISIYTDNLKLKFSGYFVKKPELFRSKLEAVSGTQRKLQWNGLVRTQTDTYLSYLVPIYDYSYANKIIAVLELMLDVDDLDALFNQGDTRDGLVFLFDHRATLIASNYPDWVDDKFAAERNNWRPNSQITFNDGEYFFLDLPVDNAELSIADWHINYMIPLKGLEAGTRETWTTTLLISLLCIVIATLFIIILSRSMTRRIDTLMAKMRQVRKGNMKISVTVKGQDEIAQLSDHFNIMVQELDHLIREIVDVKLQMKDAEIKKQQSENARNEARLLALQSQIKPHYLFNTLESIRMHLLVNGDKETADIIQLFAESFRNMTYNSAEEMVGIREELHFMGMYLKIQQFRHRDKLTLVSEVEDGLAELTIPKFIIQPLVENAIYHGLEMKDGPGRVELGIWRRQSWLYIRVTDDGVGLAQPRLKALVETLDNDDDTAKKGALKNIKNRLKLLFGDRAQLVVNSTEDSGTEVIIRLPAEG